jgi:hypothetical protein
MAIVDEPVGHDFWDVAPELAASAEDLQDALERTTSVSAVSDEVFELASTLPRFPEDYAQADPYLTRALQSGAISALLAVRNEDRSALRIAIEQVRQALRDMLDERPVWRAGPKDAAVWLGHAGLSTDDLAELFSVSPETIRRWVNPDNTQCPTGEQADKVVVVAKIVNHLRHAMTPRGAMQRLMRSHPALDDRRPVEELKDAESYRQLIRLASNARSFVAT